MSVPTTHAERNVRTAHSAMLAVLFVLCFALASSPLWAQGYRATLNGQVTDPSGASVPGAAVTAKNVANGTVLRGTSQADGRFVITHVSPGTYDVTTEAKGFKQSLLAGIVVHVNDVLTINIPLEVGEVQATVTVSGATPVLTPESASLGMIVENRVITDMPLFGRNVNMLVRLAPGVIPTGNSGVKYATVPSDRGNPVLITTSGAPEKSNLFLLNGTWARAGGSTSYTPSVESVQEFKMQRNPYDAEYGHASGAIANITTKSGTNEFHGSLYEFHRNRALDANYFFSNKNGLPKPPFTYNQWGGTIGGPVRLPGYDGRNRTFFFFNYEGMRWVVGAGDIQSTVPSEAQRRGDFSTTRTAGGAPVTIYDPLTVAADAARPGQFIRQPFSGNRIPETRFDPVARSIMGYYPRPNLPGNPQTGRFNFTYAGGSPLIYHQTGARVDHNISDKSRISAMWGYMPYHDEAKRPTPPGLGGGTGKENTTHVNLDFIRTFSPSLVMNVNLGYQRANLQRLPYSLGFDVCEPETSLTSVPVGG